MWQDPEKKLTDHLQKTNTLQIESLILAEWNMNDFQKIANTGTYRYRPLTSSSQYYRLPTKYDPLDIGDFYTDAEKSFFTFADFVDENDEPVIFQSEDVNRKLYFDIEQCFYPFRPRSGINKLLYFNQGKTYIDNIKTARRPRYYMSTRYDTFKYWNSYKKQVVGNVPTVVEYGISRINNPTGFNNSIGYLIEDVAPFVVYEESVPANRIVVKMQTNLSEIPESDITTLDGTRISDPLGTRSNSSIPQRWKIEYLDEDNNWIEAISFDENSYSGISTVNWDGYVELSYGVKLSKPEVYGNQFHFVGYIDNVANLPLNGTNHGEAYIVGLNETSSGTLYIWDSIEEAWYTEVANYGFSLYEENDSKKIGVLSSLTDSKYYLINGKKVYSEFIYLKGLRLSVSTMIGQDKTFDLIELSPRLKVNISDYVLSFNITKSIGNDNTKLPVGSLLASNGGITLMNIDDVFAKNNTNSIVSKYLKPNIKFDIYEIVLNVDGYDKYIPIQSMYTEDFPNAVDGIKEISVPLRDQFFRFETMRAPDIFLTNATLTSIIAMLLDHCGFSNYVFKGFDDLRTVSATVTDSIEYPIFYPPKIVTVTRPGSINTIDLEDAYRDPITKVVYDLEQQWRAYWQAAKQYGFTPVSREITKQDKINFLSSIYDPVIPFFFINNQSSVAETLSELANATQTAMYFDEYNNFVIMPKEYLMPSTRKQRSTDLILYGQTTDSNLANIISIDGSEEQILNDGVIQYSIKYIQRTYNSLAEAQYVDQDKTFVYKPVLLWEVGSNQELRSQDGDKTQSSGYALTAVTLNTSLTESIPTVVSNNIVNNIIDIGESALWIGRFQGYLYANGEIIRYDAVEFSVSGVGNVWITSNREYQHYFSKLPFNGKIYQTGNIRIFVEPYYENITSISDVDASAINLNQGVRYKNGAVQRHGRGQFGTTITSHSAGLPSYWSDRANVRGIRMEKVQEYLFNTKTIDQITYPAAGPVTTVIGESNSALSVAQDATTRNGIIKNFLRRSYPTDDTIRKLKSTSSGTIQSSALVFTGPIGALTASDKTGFVSYVYKELPSNYKHFGTRMRIIGRYLEDSARGQLANNGTVPSTYYSVTPTNSTDSVSISGGSGGIAVGINPNTNHGYFFEICALDNTNLQDYTEASPTDGKTTKVLHNIVFYKTYNRSDNIGVAIPKKLWGGLGTVTIDEGLFVGQDRVGIEDKPTVYDLAVEYKNIGSTRRFYLYINNKEIAVVDDPEPLPQYYNIALFIRGQSQCMFENVYALQNLQSDNSDALISSGAISRTFGDDIITTSDVMRKYSISGFVKSSFLTGISPTSAPTLGIYFEEFGTILRECAYFNIRYDQAYPALRAILAPTFNNERGYTVSAFNAGAYGAEFLIFNTTDKAIVLDESTGNYLRILGVTFTQEISEELNVDDFFKQLSNFSNPSTSDGILRSPIVSKEIFDDIKSSRKKYGKREFNIQSQYIQSSEDANKLMEWIMTKVLRKRDKLTINAFGIPHVQLGDLVTINYESNDINYINTDQLFVVQGISNSKDATNKSTQLVLVEV